MIPKQMRDDLGLSAGQEIDIVLRDGALAIEPAPTPMHLEEEGGHLVAVADVAVPPLTSDLVRGVLDQVRR